MSTLTDRSVDRVYCNYRCVLSGSRSQCLTCYGDGDDAMQLKRLSGSEQDVSIPLNVQLSILDDVCLGLRYLHSRDPPLVHRDLTPNNILLGGHLEAKITDLGITKAIKKDSKVTMTKTPGTPGFMPPAEALSIRPIYGNSLDVFSFGGVVLYTAVHRWPELDEREQFNGESGKFEVISEVKRRQNHLDILAIRNADLQRLVVSCLNDVANTGDGSFS